MEKLMGKLTEKFMKYDVIIYEKTHDKINGKIVDRIMEK